MTTRAATNAFVALACALWAARILACTVLLLEIYQRGFGDVETMLTYLLPPLLPTLGVAVLGIILSVGIPALLNRYGLPSAALGAALAATAVAAAVVLPPVVEQLGLAPTA
jgi:hypothetical protein